MQKKLLLASIFACLMTLANSCKKSDAISSSADIQSYSISGMHASVSIDESRHSINISFPDTVFHATNLIANFTLSPGATATVNNVIQASGSSQNDYESSFSYTVTQKNGMTIDWLVTSTNNSYSVNWGLGNFINSNQNNNRDYNWYIDQITTGYDSIDNCGPTATTMVCKWADSTYNKTVAYARTQYVPQGGWWFTTDIDNFLTNNNITHGIISLDSTAALSAQILEKQIDNNQVVILCVDMNYFRATISPNYHVDKFYSTTPGDGHFLVVKGYTQVGNEIHFITYDPNSWGQTYSGGQFKGLDRYYRFEDIQTASQNWWPFAIIIAQNGKTLITDNVKPLLLSSIPIAGGR